MKHFKDFWVRSEKRNCYESAKTPLAFKQKPNLATHPMTIPRFFFVRCSSCETILRSIGSQVVSANTYLSEDAAKKAQINTEVTSAGSRAKARLHCGQAKA